MIKKMLKENNEIMTSSEATKERLLRWNSKALIVIIIITLPLLGGCSGLKSYPYPKAETGIIDLTQLQFENDVVLLDGQWEFNWNRLLRPGEAETDMAGYIDVPGSWNKYASNEGTYTGDGYATYRLTFLIKEDERLALKIPRLRTAYKLWVNGELIAAAGSVGIDRDTVIPQYLTKVSFFDAHQGENEILIQVSNFHHRIGGMTESLKLGGESQIIDLKLKSIVFEFTIFGSLICIGTYHIVLFFFRRKKDSSTMYFGLFCILIGIRTMFGGECFFFYLFPEFSWEITHKILTLTYYLGVPIMLMFFVSIFPEYFNRYIVKTAQIIGGIFALIVILTPARFFTVSNFLYQIWSICVIIYIMSVFAKILINKEDDSWFIGLGVLALLISSINDIVFFSPWMNNNELVFLRTFLKIGNLTSIGQFIFASINSFLILKRFSDSLEKEEVMIAKLTEINTHLDELVFQRTKDLAESNQKIENQNLELERKNRALMRLSFKDPLTGVWNRRKYNHMIEREWRRCIRYQRPIALLFLDIDYFKGFNDFYGHMAGDECLTKIGKVLKNSLSRSTDMVARYGGEEFIVLLSEAGKEDAIKTAEMLRQKIEDLKIPHEKSPLSYVTVSIGCTFSVPDINSAYHNLFTTADKALYQAKDAGRNQVKFLSEANCRATLGQVD